MDHRIIVTARFILPRSIRSYIRRGVLDRTMLAVLDDPLLAVRTSKVVDRLIFGWGNDWSAREEFLRRMVELTDRTKHDVLECGSGLSTLILASAARKAGVRVWSLEHEPVWRERVQAALQRYQLTDVATVLDAPLQSYGDYDWYHVPPIPKQIHFGLVICDGPPIGTRGERYGLIPVLRSRFAPDAVLLLDDAARSQEQAVLARWQAETGRVARLGGSRKPYAEMVL